jgi:hypothetical protein
MNHTQAYKLAKLAVIGDTVHCPKCKTEFKKDSYNKTFCSIFCKDNYWNTVDPRKRNNTTRISPANARYYANHIAPRRDDNFDDDPSWDAHKDSF